MSRVDEINLPQEPRNDEITSRNGILICTEENASNVVEKVVTKISKSINSKQIHTAFSCSEGVKVYFKEPDNVCKILSKKADIKKEHGILIYPLVTQLTLCNVLPEMGESFLTELIQSNYGPVLNMEPIRHLEREGFSHIKSNEWRVVIDLAENIARDRVRDEMIVIFKSCYCKLQFKINCGIYQTEGPCRAECPSSKNLEYFSPNEKDVSEISFSPDHLQNTGEFTTVASCSQNNRSDGSPTKRRAFSSKTESDRNSAAPEKSSAENGNKSPFSPDECEIISKDQTLQKPFSENKRPLLHESSSAEASRDSKKGTLVKRKYSTESLVKVQVTDVTSLREKFAGQNSGVERENQRTCNVDIEIGGSIENHPSTSSSTSTELHSTSSDAKSSSSLIKSIEDDVPTQVDTPLPSSAKKRSDVDVPTQVDPRSSPPSAKKRSDVFSEAIEAVIQSTGGVLSPNELRAFLNEVKGKHNRLSVAEKYTNNIEKLIEQLKALNRNVMAQKSKNLLDIQFQNRVEKLWTRLQNECKHHLPL